MAKQQNKYFKNIQFFYTEIRINLKGDKMSTTLPKYLPLLSVYLPASPYPSFLPLPVILILFSYPLLKPQNLTGLRTVTDSNKGSMIFEKN